MKKNYEMPTAEIVEFENILEGSYVYSYDQGDDGGNLFD